MLGRAMHYHMRLHRLLLAQCRPSLLSSHHTAQHTSFGWHNYCTAFTVQHRCTARDDGAINADAPQDAPPPPLQPALYLVATPIGNLDDLSPRALSILRDADVVLAEDTRHTRKLFARYGLSTPLQSYHEHNEHKQAPQVVQRLLQGAAVALVSDAGMPGISDPGTLVVAAAVQAGVRVVPIPGPCAFTTALAASGLDTTACHFVGFLPPKQAARRTALATLGDLQGTVAVYVSPHSLRAVLADMGEVVGMERRIVLARELTKVHEEFIRGTVEEVQEHYTQRDPRGEYVLLMQGTPGSKQASPVSDKVQWDDALGELLAGGMKTAAAAKTIAKWFGVSRKQVYGVALMMSKGKVEEGEEEEEEEEE